MRVTDIKNRINQTVIFPRQHRLLFYSIMGAQLRAGAPLSSACETLANLTDLSPALRKIAKAGAQAGYEGRSVIDGLADTGMLPDMDVGVFRVAESRGTLVEAIEAVESRASDKLGFADKVILPNLYYIFLFGILVFFAFEAEDFAKGLFVAGNSDNMAVKLSVWLNAWGFITGVGAVALASVVTYGKVSWIGPLRRMLPFFDTEARYQFGVRFCSLAEMLARNGASHLEILDAAESVMGSRFTQHHIRSARTAMNVRGMAFEDAIGGGLLTAEHAELLSGMAPGGRRDLYAQAFRTVGIVQKRILETRYMVVEGMFRALLLLSIMLLLITLGKGMYTMLTNIAG